MSYLNFNREVARQARANHSTGFGKRATIYVKRQKILDHMRVEQEFRLWDGRTQTNEVARMKGLDANRANKKFAAEFYESGCCGHLKAWRLVATVSPPGNAGKTLRQLRYERLARALREEAR
jgi:hypothetical protein